MPKSAQLCRRTILVVSTEDECCLELKSNLVRQGYSINTAVGESEAVSLLHSSSPCFVIIDLDIEDTDSLMLLGAIRPITDAYIMVIGERQAEDNLIVALELAADAYLTKPFGLNKILAHFRAYHRRCPYNSSNHGDKMAVTADRGYFSQAEELLSAQLEAVKRAKGTFAFADFLFNGNGFGLRTIDGVAVELTPRELALFQLLIANKGTSTTVQNIFEHVYKREIGKNAGTHSMLVSRLRRKLADNSSYGRLIVGSPRFGYMIGVDIRECD